VTVPTAAVQRGPNGTFVYVIDAESKVAVRPITIAMQDDARAVISDGVKAQEQVVTTGFTRLSNGTRVRVQAGEGEPQPDVAPGAPPQKSEGAPQTSEGAPTERRRKREGGGSAENTDGKQWRKRSETTPATPSAKQ
jgi:multidrug efflux system membrane fusion protein